MFTPHISTSLKHHEIMYIYLWLHSTKKKYSWNWIRNFCWKTISCITQLWQPGFLATNWAFIKICWAAAKSALWVLACPTSETVVKAATCPMPSTAPRFYREMVPSKNREVWAIKHAKVKKSLAAADLTTLIMLQRTKSHNRISSFSWSGINLNIKVALKEGGKRSKKGSKLQKMSTHIAENHCHL